VKGKNLKNLPQRHGDTENVLSESLAKDLLKHCSPLNNHHIINRIFRAGKEYFQNQITNGTENFNSSNRGNSFMRGNSQCENSWSFF
jgi:hypothetical protein